MFAPILAALTSRTWWTAGQPQDPPRWAFAICAAIALASIWLPTYPAGIDLPQHANLFQVGAQLVRGDTLEYRRLFQSNWFTPYLLPYGVGIALTLGSNALIACKCLLSFAALATPWGMTRWLAAVGSARIWGLLGFLLAFDFNYEWGFLSHVVAMPLLFGYLERFERQLKAPCRSGVFALLAWGTALFFSHGITFGVGMLVSALSLLARPSPLQLFRHWLSGLHFPALFALSVAWAGSRSRGEASRTEDWWCDTDRLLTLFSGAFWPHPSWAWAAVSLGLLGLLALVARPRLLWTPASLSPILVSAALFCVLPEWLASTWLVGRRLCVFVHAFAPALFLPRLNRAHPRRLVAVVTTVVVLALAVQTTRGFLFNRELEGFTEISQHIPDGEDIQTLVPKTRHTSRYFGRSQLGQVPAWHTALQGGLIANDYTGYHQMPLTKRGGLFPNRWRHIVLHGSERQVKRALSRHRLGRAKLAHRSGDWYLYRLPRRRSGPATIVRSAQGWGRLRVNHAVSGKPLQIGKKRFRRGIGTHSPSLIRLRFPVATTGSNPRRFRVGYGLNDRAGGRGSARFRIVDNDDNVLFESEPVKTGDKVQYATVELSGRRELLLETLPVGSKNHTHTDWVKLQLVPPETASP